ncbi:protein phosphatase 1 regulatory subunit 12A-like [Episyrphus balteatus]|uniref:protein phosphatase 1 regulatory subunit 12A-like n=1 Tax=Episyrphus balteatus TaxID=286459 RepID=UPI0024854D41|nr:protein phosphatase 1 regulatory subunit 12A-like [Episyrphus balteatus]
MSFDTRNNSAMMKRAEQLKRWEESETNREPSVPKSEKGRKIKFSSGCVFLAACLAGDKEEVVNLIENGADINTANVDGLTALHQACIDDNLDMVEFLVEHGADINRQDNEGWTPLHATASCGFVSIARYLVEHGADISAVNSDGELAVDLAVDIAHLSPMIEYMQKLVAEHNIDCDKARRAEEEMMLSDAKRWLRSDASEADNPHPKTGATALHVAAAKGYKKVLSLLLAGRANVDKQDNDGWTPLHAAAHWGQKESAEMLVDALADMDVRNYAGQTCIDVAERKMVKFLEDLRANNKRMKRRPSSQISSRISDTIENHIENTPTKFIRVEVKPDTKDPVNEHIEEDGLSNLERITESDETDSELTDSTESSHSTSISEAEGIRSYDKPKLMPEKVNSETAIDEDAPWRRGSAARTRNQPESPPKNQVPEKDVKSTESDVILRRTQSFENDEKFYQKYNELRARIKANSCPILPATQNPNVLGTVNTPIQNYSVQRSASLKDHRYFRKPITSPPASPNTPVATPNSTAPTTPTTPNTTPIRSPPTLPPKTIQNNNNNINKNANTNNNINTTNNNTNGDVQNKNDAAKQKMSPGTIFKNFFKSFVPPVRDEESETQRKAHAKRVRETRRSTQGVTLDEIKSAEELVKKKNSTMNNNNNTSEF